MEGKVIGESRIQVTLQLPSSVVPSLSSISLSDLNTIAQNAITGNTFVSLESNPRLPLMVLQEFMDQLFQLVVIERKCLNLKEIADTTPECSYCTKWRSRRY